MAVKAIQLVPTDRCVAESVATKVASWLGLKPVSIAAEVKRADLTQGFSDQLAFMGMSP